MDLSQSMKWSYLRSPNEIYNELMQELHHHAPNDEEGKLANGVVLGDVIQ